MQSAATIEGASAARIAPPASPPGAFRSGILIQVKFLAGVARRHDQLTLFGAHPTEAAKAICDACLIYPEHLEVHSEDRDFAWLTDRRTGCGVGVVEATPWKATIAERLAQAFVRLAAEQWCPIRPWFEVEAELRRRREARGDDADEADAAGDEELAA